MKTFFGQHGSYELQVNGSILVATLHGAWNQITAINYANDFKQKANSLTEKPWGHLVFLNDWETGTPEIRKEIITLVDWCIHHNLKRAAHVYSPSAFKKYFINTVVIEHQGDFTRHAFSEPETALSWLKTEGFELECKQKLAASFLIYQTD